MKLRMENLVQSLRNKVQLIGNIGSDPKVTVLESGSKTVRFSMAAKSNVAREVATGEEMGQT